jgi:DNA-binding transcriptional regulator YiaG
VLNKSEATTQLQKLVQSYPHNYNERHAKDFISKVISIYRSSDLSLSAVATVINVQVGLVCKWNKKYKQVSPVFKEASLLPALFYPVKIKEAVVSTRTSTATTIELISPRGYIIKGLTSSSVVEVLRGLHV